MAFGDCRPLMTFHGHTPRKANLSSRGLRKSFIIGLLVWHVNVLEVIAIFLAGERWAGFVDAFEFAVTHDLGIGVVDLQGAE